MDVYRPSRPEQQLPEQDPPEQGLPSRNLRLLHSIAMTVGVGLALLVSSFGGPVALWGKISRTSALQNKSSVSSAATFSDSDLDRQNPQKQAEILLERAVSRSDGARAQSGGSEDQIEAQIEARIDAWRGQRGESPLDEADGGDSGERLRTGDPDALEQLLDFERGAMLAACMHELPAIHREVLTLRFEEDMKLEEIAEVAGIPLATVKSRLSRALEGLRAAINARSPRRKGA